MSRLRIDGFYAILDRDDESLARALAAHACVLQVRIKPGEAADIVRAARMARRVCDAAGIGLVVNDRVDIALAVGADGVHLGQTDLPIEVARDLADDRLAIGISTHDADQVRRAVAAGADYLGYGPVFPTRTKQNPDPVQGVEALAEACRIARDVPVVAIGGITPADATALYAAGVSAICAIGAVNAAANLSVAASALRRPC